MRSLLVRNRVLLLLVVVVVVAIPTTATFVRDGTLQKGTRSALHKQQQQQQQTQPALVFPGIYTTVLYSELTPKIATTRTLKNWDLIDLDCTIEQEYHPDYGNNNNASAAAGAAGASSGLRVCEGYLLIQSQTEYNHVAEAMMQKLWSSSSSSLSSDGTSDSLQQLRGTNNDIPGTTHHDNDDDDDSRPFSSLLLAYNATLTDEWVRPRLSVLEAHRMKRTLVRERESLHNYRAGELIERDIFVRKKTATTNSTNHRIRIRRGAGYSTIDSEAGEYDCYYDYDGTMDWIEDFVEDHKDSPWLSLEWKTIGESWLKTQDRGGDNIHALTLTGSSSGGGSGNKAPLFLVSGVHAREYTPPILVRLWLEDLIDRIDDGDPGVVSMLETTEIHWIPYLNPDGRRGAESSEPMRRKNTNWEWSGGTDDRNTCDAETYGVDLNRNMPFEWGNDEGSSDNPCSQIARGNAAGSEPESRALEEYANRVFPSAQRAANAINDSNGDYDAEFAPVLDGASSRNWRGYDPQTTRGVFIDIHSYGEVYIYPWGNTYALAPNDFSFRSAMGHVESLTGYEAKGPGNDHFGAVSGATDDWAYGTLGAFAMTWELGRSFHEPCTEFEDDYQKHFPAFDYLATLAPFPYALGKGPIVVDIDHDETVPLDNDLTLKLKLQLPDILSTNLDPIDFDSSSDSSSSGSSSSGSSSSDSSDEEEEPSYAAFLRVFYGGNNPLASATTASETFDSSSSSSSSNSDNDAYWEFELDEKEQSSGKIRYKITISSDRLLQAFGSNESQSQTQPQPQPPKMLYVQAMDNVGNVGPIEATRVTLVPKQTPEPTRKPTRRPTPKPTTKRPTKRPTPKPSTKRPTNKPSSKPPTQTPTRSAPIVPTDETPLFQRDSIPL